MSHRGIQICLSNIYWEQEEQKGVGIPQNWAFDTRLYRRVTDMPTCLSVVAQWGWGKENRSPL